jgi:DNA (cytosine-5)-methyltransferase 1
MWREMARIICEVQPQFVFVENSPMLTSRGLGRVLGDLAQMGFDAKWGVLGGEDVGAVHRRDRIWIVASNDSQIRLKCDIKKQIPKFTPFPWGKDVRGIEDLRNRSDLSPSIIWRKDYGVADYVDRISAIGNGQIPRVAATAWTILSERI